MEEYILNLYGIFLFAENRIFEINSGIWTKYQNLNDDGFCLWTVLDKKCN